MTETHLQKLPLSGVIWAFQEVVRGWCSSGSLVMHTQSFHCHGRDCQSTDLIKAHIIPQWFGRSIQSPRGANALITSKYRTQKFPNGMFDSKILCATCDGHLNKRYDDPAIEIFQNLQITNRDMNMRRTRFIKRNIECNILCEFFLSVLWRASISDRCNGMTLGKYEDEVRDVLFDIKPFSSLVGFEVLVFRYRSKIITNLSGLYCLPRALSHNLFGFALAGFRIVVKLDPCRFLPDDHRNVLNGQNVLRGQGIEFEKTPECYEILEFLDHRQ